MLVVTVNKLGRSLKRIPPPPTSTCIHWSYIPTPAKTTFHHLR